MKLSGKLVERPVEVVVDAGIALEHADQDFAIELVVAIVGEAGALADQDAVGRDRGDELVGDLRRSRRARSGTA